MKVRISYFYQIRNFKSNMIPMSTCISDPKWYHDFKGKNHLFVPFIKWDKGIKQVSVLNAHLFLFSL